MRVLIEDGFSLERPGGIGRYTRFLLENLPRVGVEPIQPRRPAWRGGRLFRRARYLFWLNGSFYRQTKEKGAVLAHFTNFVAPWRREESLPLVVTVHDLAVWRVPEAFPRGYATYLRQAVKWSVRVASRVVTVSQAVKEEVIEVLRLPEEKVVVIPNAVDPFFLEAPPPSSEERLAWRRRLGFSGDAYLLLYVGALEFRKGLSFLFRALESLWKEGVPVGLVLAGRVGHGFSFPPPSPFWCYVPSPSDEELVRLYDLADALILPSRYEGFGLPVVEALARGRTPILSDLPVFREVAGSSALYFPFGDEEALRASILRAMEGENRLEGHRRQLHRFLPENVLRAYKTLYEEVVR